MPSKSLEKGSRGSGSSRASTRVKTAERKKTSTKGRSGSGASKSAKQKLSTSKALVPVSSQQNGLTTRERLAKKRAANGPTKRKSTRKKSGRSTKVQTAAKRKRRTTATHESLSLVEQPWFIPTIRALYEGTLVIAVAAIALLLIALLTYHPADSGFSQVGITDEIRNLGGRGGAWIADLSFSLLGYAAYWVPVVLGYVAFTLFNVGRKPWSGLLVILRSCGHLGVLMAGSVIAMLHFPQASMPMAPGGILGEELVIRLETWLSPLGSSIFALAILLLTLSMIFDLSWSSIAGWIGRQVLAIGEKLLGGYYDLKAANADWRENEPWSDHDKNHDDAQVVRAHLEEGGPRETWLSQWFKRSPAESSAATSAEEGLGLEEADYRHPTERVRTGLMKLRATQERFLASVKMKRQHRDDRAPFGSDDSSGLPSEIKRRSEPTMSDALFDTYHEAGWENDQAKAGESLMLRDQDRHNNDKNSDNTVAASHGQPLSSSENFSEKSLEHNSSHKTIEVKSCVEGEGTGPVAAPMVMAPDSKATSSVQSKRKHKKKALFNRDLLGDLPPVELLDPAEKKGQKGYSEEALQDMSRLLELKLRDFNIEAEVEAVIPGPVVTRFEIQPAPGIKVMRITNLAKDLARSLAVISVRVVEVIPGKTTVGIEIPNSHRETIRLRDVICSEAYEDSKSSLTLCLGKDISGHSVTADLAKMPHLLVAGTTGSGKSVGLNAMLISMLFKATPDQLRMIMIDPKMLELSVYDDIPHLLSPVVTDMKEAANALRWCVAEMERRYRLMAAMGVRNLAGFNRKVVDAQKDQAPLRDPLWKPLEQGGGEAPELETLPNIVVVIDEFADMMMIVGKKVEELIARIAQKARAAGIHLILATQRPSVDVITGLIKANVPSRIAFQVSSKIDSRTILDQGGAEQLLGFGDMLYLPPGTALPLRVHGAFVSDEEVHRVCDDWRERGEPDYLDEVLDGAHEAGNAPGFEPEKTGDDAEADPLYDEAVKFVTQTRKASISSVQRKLKIGYNRAARMVESMEAAGVITPMQNNGSREVIAPPPI